MQIPLCTAPPPSFVSLSGTLGVLYVFAMILAQVHFWFGLFLPRLDDVPKKRQECIPGDLCRPAAGNCDFPEYCSVNGTCPEDLLQNQTLCRSSVGYCDYEEFCDGTSPHCPGDVFNPDEVTCHADWRSEIIGYIGGALLAACLFPQFYLIYCTGSARDISLGWTILYVVGLSFSLAYLVLLEALAGWVSMLIELVFACLLLGIKIWYDFARTCNTSVKVEKGHGGAHVLYDFRIKKGSDPAELGKWAMDFLLESLKSQKVRVVYKNLDVFDATSGAPGFTIMIMIEEGHVSVHSFTEPGNLSFDVLACQPGLTKFVSKEILKSVAEKFPGFKQQRKTTGRFPGAVFDLDSKVPTTPRTMAL